MTTREYRERAIAEAGYNTFLLRYVFLPHVPQEQCPAQSLTAAIYTDS